MRAITLTIICAAVFAVTAGGQTVTHPDKGSTERAALLDTIRPSVEKELKQKIVFVIHQINVEGSWAFVDGRLRTPSGKVPNWKNTPYAMAESYGAQSDGISALLRMTRGKWKIVTTAIGCTDVCYVDWWRKYKAPKAIFPYTE
jgi:hypothetical protein